jgi:hypothetical protein
MPIVFIIFISILSIVGIGLFMCLYFIGMAYVANGPYDSLEEFFDDCKSVRKRSLFEDLVFWAEAHSPKDYQYNKKNYYDACDAWAEDLFKQIPVYKISYDKHTPINKVKYDTAVQLCRKVYDLYKEEYNLYDRDWAAEDINKQRYENRLAQQQQHIQDKVDQLMNERKNK